MLSGDTIGPHGRMTAGAYFWRPAGIPHGPFGSRDGGCLLIRFREGRHVNDWGADPVPYSFDFPYSPQLPPDLEPYGREVYAGPDRF